MVRSIALFLGICGTIVPAADGIDWPPLNLEGAWRVLRVSEDNPLDDIEHAKIELLIITKDFLILAEAEFPRAYGHRLSDGEVHATGYRAKMHMPTETIDFDGGRKYGTTKEPITFAIERERKAKLEVTIDYGGAGLRIQAERMGTNEARKTIDKLLADPDFESDPVKIRALLKSFAKDDREPHTKR
jgi:hypothetical protein